MNRLCLSLPLFAFCLAACGTTANEDVFPGDAASEGSIVPAGDGGVASADGGTTTIPGQDGGIVGDAGPGGDTTTLTCGVTSCALPAQVCCATRVGGGGSSSFQFVCITGSSCPVVDGGGRPTTLKCASAANCGAGEVCCIAQNNGTTSSCMTQAACDGAQGDTAVLCDPASPGTGCPPNEPCSTENIDEWRLPPGFGTCGGQGN